MDLAQYASLSRDQLIARLASFEEASSTPGAGPSKPKPTETGLVEAGRKRKPKPVKTFDFSSYPTRRVALLVAYHGERYSGLALQNPTDGGEAVNTIELELLKALEKGRLIEEGKGWPGCEFSRCGRTDAGVSGHGQVVSLRVRSNRQPEDGGATLDASWRGAENPRPPKVEPTEEISKVVEVNKPRKVNKPNPPRPPIEYSYPRVLNGALPPDIRVLAWSPIEEEFDARFSCSYRHYKYAFHVRPIPHLPELEINLMQQTAQDLVGEHDFRNFCKVDGAKMIENHSRRVIRTWIEDGEYAGLKVFNLIGTAFLWHQVRHIIAALFLVGAKLEPPSLVKDLLDVERFPGKPTYNMGLPLPLTLWECGFQDGKLDWRYTGYDGPWSSLSGEERHTLAGKETHAALEAELEEQRQVAELQAWQIGGSLRKLRAVLGSTAREDNGRTNHVPVGGGRALSTSVYKPVTERPMLESPEETNRKWWAKNRPGKPMISKTAGDVDME